MTTTNELWRSKLGTNYPKDFMVKNEARLLKELQAIRDLPENQMCADCGTQGTVWASVNLGVFLCMTCGAHHRSLGTHISLPKGCTGTYWWGPDEIERMKAIGNARAKQLYGEHTPQGLSKDDSHGWKQHLNEKYVRKAYVQKVPTGTLFDSHNATHASPPGSPSSRRSNKFTNQPMPDIDLIHFESTSPVVSSPKGVVPSPQHHHEARIKPLPATGDDFFASFGV